MNTPKAVPAPVIGRSLIDRELLEAAVNQNDAMRQELANVGNLVSDLARALRVDQAEADGTWPDLGGRIGKLIAAARADSLEVLTAQSRVEIVEECARVVEALPERILEFWDRPGGPPGNGYRPLRQSDCVAAIRALSTERDADDGARG